MSKSDDPKYVIQKRHKTTGNVWYLSPGKVNWVTPDNHTRFGTRYGAWVWSIAEDISASCNRGNKDPNYEYTPLPKSKHP